MPDAARTAGRLLLVCALAWHALVLALHWREASRDGTGRDFASYYYAVQVAFEGGDPYERSELGGQARADQVRRGVHPFFYPPPFVLAVAWMQPLELVTAYRLWFWLDELAALLVALVLWRWWRPLGPGVGVMALVFLALLTGLPNNHVMGQANLPTMLLVLLGLRLDAEDRQVPAGALLGVACMWKMSPALFVAWWLLRRRWLAAGSSVATAVVLSVLSLPLVGLADQLRFYTEVLPGFSSGDYNGLSVGIDLYGNHSVPAIFDGWFPAGPGHLRLSDTARTLSTVFGAAVVGGVGWSIRRAPADLLARAGQLGAVGVVMLLVPVITYEHHLVWALPAAAAVVAAIATGRLSARWTVPVALALVAWCFDLQLLRNLSGFVRESAPWLSVAIREVKLASLVCLLLGAVVVGRSTPRLAGAAHAHR